MGDIEWNDFPETKPPIEKELYLVEDKNGCQFVDEWFDGKFVYTKWVVKWRTLPFEEK